MLSCDPHRNFRARGNCGVYAAIAVTVSRHVTLSRHIAGMGYENKNARGTKLQSKGIRAMTQQLIRRSALICTLLTGLAACGSGSDSSSGAASNGTSSTATGTGTTSGTTSTSTGGTSATSTSANGTVVGAGGQIVDSALHRWTVTNGVVMENSTQAGYSANVVSLVYSGGTVYQENSDCKWWSWSGTAWVSAANPDPAAATTCPSTGSGKTADSTSDTGNSAGTLAFSSSVYSASPAAGQIVVTVNRSGGGTGAAAVAYTTAAGTAQPTADYTTTSGTLSWAAGETTAKSFPVKLTTTAAGGKSLSAKLLSATGASLGTTATATLSIATTAAAGTLSVHASGSQLIDGSGNALQLRGANISVLESLFLGATSNYWAGANLGTYPFWAPIKSWKMNAVRIPLNEATWLRYPGVDIMNVGGGTHTPDASDNYRATVEKAVKDANAAGIYVILDLHWTAPGDYLANTQDQLPDTDHTIAFWTSLAQIFGNNPGVIFDLFNEPYPKPVGSQNAYDVELNGATQSTISFNSGKSSINYTWTSVGMQELVDTIRNAGATNLLMVGGAKGSTDLSGFTTAGGGYFPKDPLKNIAASWHAYGVSSAGFTTENVTYSQTINPTTIADQVLAQGIPIVVGELGDNSSNGSTGAPVTSYITSWADAHGQSVLPWTWDAWSPTGGKGNLLIKDASGTPTDGEGVTYKAWLAQH
jgi:endoglucanase